MTHVLIVGNQSLLADELHEAVRRRMDQGPCTLEIVVPATPLTDQQAALAHSEQLRNANGETGSVALARWRLKAALHLFAERGIEITGDIGHASPVRAAREAAERRQIDEVIVSTLSRGASRWLSRGVPKRIHRALGVPVTHVETAKVIGVTRSRVGHDTPSDATTPIC